MESSSPTANSTISSINLPTIHPISVKLDRSNYSFWKIQVYATARAFGFEDVLQSNSAPAQFIRSESADSSTPNPDYQVWLRRDQFVFSWILASISPSMIGYVGRSSTSAQLWQTFEALFHSQSKARSMQLKLQLQTLKKGDSLIDEYILKLRSISDQLFSIGQPISDADLVTHILNGLGREYESISIFLQSKCEDLTIHETQFALQTHELRLQNQATPALNSSNFQPQANVAFNPQGYRGRGRSGGRNFGSRGRGRGRFNGGYNSNKPACQLCGLTNHIALKCYRRFDVSFNGPEPPSSSTPQAHTISSSSAPLPHFNSGYSNMSQVSQSSSTPYSHQHYLVPASVPGAYSISSNQSTGAEWYLDSGASAHVTADFNNLQIQAPYHGNESLTVGQTQSPNPVGRHT